MPNDRRGPTQGQERLPPPRGVLSARCVALTSWATGPVGLRLPASSLLGYLRLHCPCLWLPQILSMARARPQHWRCGSCSLDSLPTSVSEAGGVPGAKGTGRAGRSLGSSWSVWCLVWTPASHPSQRDGSGPVSRPVPHPACGAMASSLLPFLEGSPYRIPRPAAAPGTRNAESRPLSWLQNPKPRGGPGICVPTAVLVLCHCRDRVQHAQ